MRNKRESNGIYLGNRIVKDDGKKWFTVWMLVPVLYMMLGAYGFMRTMLQFAQPSYAREPLYGCMVLFGVWFGCLYLIKRGRAVLTIISLSVFAVFVWKKFQMFQIGIEALAEAFMYAGDPGYSSAAGMLKETTFALICILFVLYCLFFCCLCIESGKYLIILWMLIPVCMAFAFYKIPDGVGVFCMIFAVVGLIVAGPEERSSMRGAAALLTGLLGVLVLVVGNVSVRPVIAPWFEGKEKLREKIQKTSPIEEMRNLSEKWWGGNAAAGSRGVNEGGINSADFFSSEGKALFTVSQTERPEDSLYLKVYTGSEYTQKQWRNNEDTEPALASFYEYAKALASQNGYDGACSLYISVEESQKDRLHAYAPYFSDYMGVWEGSLHYEYYPVSWIGSPFSLEPNESAQEYREYVYSHYLDYPAENLPHLQAFCDENPRTDIQSICTTVRQYLSENATYDPQTGRFPEDMDFAEYFLYEQRTGYCVHFATAAVLMMRMYGVPARYVTGYAVPADAFEKNTYAWEAEVKDENAHAWAEIYIDSLGWIPFETTPSYDSGIELSDSETQTESVTRETEERVSESARQKQTEFEQGTGSQSRKKKGDVVKTVVRVVSAGTVLLLFAIVLIFLRREMILRKRGRKDAKEIFYDLYDVLLFGGMPKSVDCMKEDFTNRVTEQFVWIEKTELDLVMDIVMRANYAGNEITKEETSKVRGMYRYICRMLLKGMKRKQRLLFRYVYAYM